MKTPFDIDLSVSVGMSDSMHAVIDYVALQNNVISMTKCYTVNINYID